MKRPAEDEVKIEDIVDEHDNNTTAADSAPQLKKARRTCPYLDTIHRNLLDFDFEKVCSVSLSNLNVYACLVCGKYFQGRGRGSHAYIHSLEVNHHVYIHLFTNKIYCLPDDYEVVDSSLDDIKRALNTTYTKEEIAQLDRQQRIGRTLDGRGWVAGVIGLNPMATGQATLNDYFNVVFQALAHVPVLRNYFLMPEQYQHCRSELVHRFGILVRKLWSPHNYRNLVTPHELLQEVTLRSEKKFKIGSKGDPLEFLSWFLNTLHMDLIGDKKRGRSVIHDCFQGQVHVTTEREELVEVTDNSHNNNTTNTTTSTSISGEGSEGNKKKRRRVKQNVVTARDTPFMYLSLDIPPPPLFKDEAERNIIPQEPIFTLLNKFNGNTVQYIAATDEKKKYQLTALPKYIIFAIKRFTNNAFFMEKNPTIVNFPIKNLDLADYVQFGNEKTSTKYDLVANIRHEGQTKKPSEGSYAVHIYHKANDQWYNIQDTRVEEVMPALIVLSEAYIQIYERNDSPA